MIALVVGLGLAGCAWNGQRPAPHTVDLAVHRVSTADGAIVAVQRHERSGAPPVLLVHGISSNHHFWDLTPERSLARHLYDAGFDVWNADLRGHGFALRDERGKKQRAPSVTAYAGYDLPALIRHVHEQTGRDDLAYVGHSLGGIVLAGYLGHTEHPGLSRAVAVASPLDLSDPPPITRVLLGGGRRFRFVRRWPTATGGRLLALLGECSPLAADALLFQRDNLEPHFRRLMLRRIVSPLVGGEVSQLGTDTPGPLAGPTGHHLADGLDGVDVPLLVLAGRGDHVATPDAVRAWVGPGRDVDFRVLSVAHGDGADYGHLDLGLGDHAKDDVYPLVTAFLRGEPLPPEGP